MAASQQMLLAAGLGNVIASGNMLATRIVTSPSTATAVVAISAGGAVTGTGGAQDFQLIVAGPGSNLEIFVTITGDTPTGSASGSWVAMGGSLAWTLAQLVVGSKSCTGTYSVRTADGHIVLGGGNFNITAQVDL